MFRRSHSAAAKSAARRPEVKRAVERLVEEFNPEAVYLFGSLAQGTGRSDSSVDILVIAPGVAAVRFIDRVKRAIKATVEELPNVAPLVYTPQEVELLKSQGDGFMTDILKEAKLLYRKK